MNYSIHTLELTQVLEKAIYEKCIKRAYTKAKGSHRVFEKKDVIFDGALASQGIKVEYHRGKYKRKVKLIVNPTKVLGSNDLRLWAPNKKSISKLIRKLESHIDDYFDNDYTLNDFQLTRIDFTVNIDVGNRKKVSAYIKVLRKLGKIKGFSPKYGKSDSHIDEDLSFDLEGNSNGVDFTAYDKEEQLNQKNADSKLIKQAKGILRLEVRLKKKKAIGKYTDETESPLQIIDLTLNSKKIFLDTFRQIVPPGDHYQMKRAVDMVKSNGIKTNRQEKMLRLMNLITEKKSLYSAQKAMNYRDVDALMGWFAGINLSPVTISKRHEVKHLESLYSLL